MVLSFFSTILGHVFFFLILCIDIERVMSWMKLDGKISYRPKACRLDRKEYRRTLVRL